MGNLEKPWYLQTILAFLGKDVPESLGTPEALFARDLHTLEHRVTMEGESFLTKTLPAFGKSFDLALQGASPLHVSGFRKRSRRSALPAFLQALLGRVFLDDGHLRTSPCIISIRLIRQLCFWCKKVEKGFTDESLRKAAETVIDVDASLPEVSISTNPRVLGLARAVVERILGDCPGISHIMPSHGPGSVAWSDGERKKERLSISYVDLEKVFRPIPWFRSLRDASENPHCVLDRPQTAFGLSRLAFVEKDSSGPRVIGLEPAEYMWCQQAVKRWLYNHIENRQNIAKGQINFTDQTINRDLTMSWSKYDTLDMSSASDRNSYSLVKLLFGRTKLWRYLDASRTPGVVMPDGTVLWYKKFAPMGSATCFPVEAMVFYAIAVATLLEAGYPFLLAHRNVFVYGDDIVAPHGYFEALRNNFESVGLKFSDGKCCIHGKFRESCGMDAYDGHNVTPVRLRRPHLLRGTLDLASLVEHSRALGEKGYTAASRRFRRDAKRQYKDLKRLHLPYTNRTDLPILSWYDNQLDTLTVRKKHSIAYVRGWTLAPIQVELSEADENFYLRESLSRGGPIGEIRSTPGFSARVKAMRYEGVLRRKTLPVVDAPASTVNEQTLDQIVSAPDMGVKARRWGLLPGRFTTA